MATTQTKFMTEAEYRGFALGDKSGQWELVRGQLREKPGMSVDHGGVMDNLLAFLYGQLDRSEYRIRTTHARLRRSSDTYYVPDVAVIPTATVQALLERPHSLDAYPDPLPLVVEIWSPSTGRYDIREKLPDYQARGDLEIWYIHPYERTLTAWRRQADGAYTETVYRSGTVYAESLPGVAIDLDTLFEP
ncbi:MAG: Uma2 family endonuclease [Thermomicrobiales bacterium]